MKRLRLISITFLLALLATACGQPKRDNLTRIIRLAETDLRGAAAALDSVDFASLSQGDRHLFSLAEIKIADKSYQKQPSAKAIDDVITYFEHHCDDPLYAEALYYGGRVYSDLGDYPQALIYFQAALKQLPENTSDPNLRANVLSQLARAEMRVRAFDIANPYLEQVIAIDRQTGDTVSLVNDLQMLGANLLHMKKYDPARRAFTDGLRLASAIRDTNLMARNKMYLAAIFHEEERHDSALMLIRGLPKKMSDSYRYAAMVYAADIYRVSGKPDTAFIYASEVIRARDTRNRRAAYEILLSAELQGFVPQDSLYSYISRYVAENERYMQENGNSGAQLQNAVYNYSAHQQRYKQAITEKGRSDGIALVLGLVCLCLITSAIVFAIRDRRVRSNTNVKTQTPETTGSGMEDETEDGNGRIDEGSQQRGRHLSFEELSQREVVISELLGKCAGYDNVPGPNPAITSSAPCREIVRKLGGDKIDRSYEQLSKELSDVVEGCCVGFQERLRTLMGGRLKNSHLIFAALVKSGFTNQQISEILSLQRNTISSRFKTMGETIFGRNCESKLVRTAIMLL